MPPYFFAGMAISLALTRSPWPVGLVYGVDLVGAATGCLLALGLMTWMDGVSALLRRRGHRRGRRRLLPRRLAREPDDAISEPAGHRWFVLRHPALLARSVCRPGRVQRVRSNRTASRRAGEGSAREIAARRPAVELVFPRQGRAGDHGTPAMWGPSPKCRRSDVRSA